MGSPAFALPVLMALREAGHDIVAVYCQPPKPVGRGLQIRKCPVHQAADDLGIEVRTPSRWRGNDSELEYLRGRDVDYGVVVAYGLILPEPVLRAPRSGCLNVHASLLPRWRGAAPIQAAILAGDARTGVTIMHMDAGLDTGPMLIAEATDISGEDTSVTLHDRLASMGARLIVRAIETCPVPTSQTGPATYAPKLSRSDAVIDWTLSAADIERRIRALNPWPGTETRLGGEPFKIMAAKIIDDTGEPGHVIDHQLTVACGSGALRLLEVKRAGGRWMAAQAFLRGHSIGPGTVLG